MIQVLLFIVSLCCLFFFFKQKTAYEIMPSLVGLGDVYKRQDWLSVLGSKIPNSSPPILETISSSLQQLFKILDISISNSSPLECPKPSLINFKPLISPIIIEIGNCLGVSSRFSSSSKKILL